MQIISNSCLGSFIYEKLNLKFNNPFTWNRIYYADMLKLCKNFNNINFENFTLTRKELLLGINIDNILNLYYPHYKYNSACITPITKHESDGNNLYMDNKIFQFILDVYNKRVSRLNKNDKPIYVIQSNRYDYTDNNVYEFLKLPIKMILFTNNNKLKKFEDKYHKIIVFEKSLINIDPKNLLISKLFNYIDQLKTIN